MTTMTMVVNIAAGCDYDELWTLDQVKALYSPDGDYCSYGTDTVGGTLENKRQDLGYDRLREDMRTRGITCPILVTDNSFCGNSCGNGHHRVAVAEELGWTHLPVTFDEIIGWPSDYSWCEPTYRNSQYGYDDDEDYGHV
jgi:hypothetical protein